MYEAVVEVIARRGPFALFAGLFVSIIGSVPSVAVYFAVYQYFKSNMLALFCKDVARASACQAITAIALSAALANCVAAVIRAPCELLKQRLQAGVYPSLSAALTALYADILRGQWPGANGAMLAQMLRDVPYAVVTLVTYESLRRAAVALRAARRRAAAAAGDLPASRDGEGDGAVPWESMVIGALAGGLGTAVTVPLDVIKTRLMVAPNLYSGVGDVISKTLAGEGVRGLTKGLLPRLLHKVPQNAIFFLVYDSFRRLLRADADP